MPSSATTTLLRRSRPSIHLLSVSIQRLTSTRQLSSTTEQGRGREGDPHQQSSSHSSETNPNPKIRSIHRWITGVTVGSALGALYHHYFNGAVEIDDSNTHGFSIFDANKHRRSCVAFADWSSAPTAEAVTASNSADSFSDKKSKFLFGDAYRRKVFFNYEKRIRLRSPPEKMFDIDNNGEIDREEFKKVMALMRSANRQGAAQRDGLRAGTKIGGSVENGGLVEYFFGKDGTGRLQHDKFVKFLRDLHDEILRLEFAHYDYLAQGSISAKDFALSMVASADIKHINKLLDRVGEIDKDPHLSKLRITEDEFRMFAELRKKLEPFSWALFSFGKISGLLTKADFQRAASQVCNVHLTDNLIDIIFHVFDANRDRSLSVDEFLRVLERREKDIAGTHVDDGIFTWLSCCWSCAKSRSSASRFIF